jgi:type IV secretion system protein VirB1
MEHATPSNREEQTRRVAESLKRQLGPFCPLLAAPDLVEPMLNANGTVWVEQRMQPVGTIHATPAESFVRMAHLVLTVSTALALALSCAPRVAPDVLLSVAYTESHWNKLAIHDNVTKKTFRPESKQEAEHIALRLIAEGHNPDLGLLQINAANLPRKGLTVATAFDPCVSMHAGAQVLLEDYSGGSTSDEQQAAILHALSAYNTGSPVAGLQTYTPLVLAAAHKVIPALRLSGVAPYMPPAAAGSSSSASSCEPGGWHYSADESYQPDASWHFSVVQDATVRPGAAAHANSRRKDNP